MLLPFLIVIMFTIYTKKTQPDFFALEIVKPLKHEFPDFYRKYFCNPLILLKIDVSGGDPHASFLLQITLRSKGIPREFTKLV